MNCQKINYLSHLKVRGLFLCKYTSDIIASIINIVIPLIIGNIIETIFFNTNITQFINGIIIYTMLFLALLLNNVLNNKLIICIDKKFLINLKSEVYYSLIMSKASNLDSLSSGDTIHTLTNDIDNIYSFYNNSISNVIISMTQLIGIIIIIGYNNILMALLIVVFSLITAFFSNISKTYFLVTRKKYRDKLGKYLQWITVHLAGMQDIRMNQAELQIEKKFSFLTNNKLKDKENIRFAEIKTERINSFVLSLFTVSFWTFQQL